MHLFDRLLEGTQTRPGEDGLMAGVLAVLLAFVLGQLSAWVYCRTHGGLSYSRSFTQSLVLIAMVVAMVIHVIGNNIVTAVGLIGALAIIRFRNVLKDTRDTVFVLFSLALGMAVGSGRYHMALVGVPILLAVTILLYVTDFGSRGRFDGHLSYSLDRASASADELAELLRAFCRRLRRLSVHHAGPGTPSEYVVEVRLRDPARARELTEELERLPGVRNAALVLRDGLMEV